METWQEICLTEENSSTWAILEIIPQIMNFHLEDIIHGRMASES
jgi:hypothetical protein